MSENLIYAPKVNPNTMWAMKASEFNEWRIKNDYPRIISFFKTNLPCFNEWLEEQNISEDLLVRYSLSALLRERECIYLYIVSRENDQEKEFLSTSKYSVGDLYNRNKVKQRTDILPYPTWYKNKKKDRLFLPESDMGEGRKRFVMHKLELLDLGNCSISNLHSIGEKHLDFTNIDDLNIFYCFGGHEINLSFCSAVNVTINGDLAFVNAYKTSFYDVFNTKYRNLKLNNGGFQSWSFENCRVNLSATNTFLHLWNFIGSDFNATINNTDIKNCEFRNSKIKYPVEIALMRDFHSNLKQLYSQIGRKKEASDHYYLEKKFERKSFLRVKISYQRLYYSKPQKGCSRFLLITCFFLKYLYSGIQNIVWGYGERPSRVLVISCVTIFLFTLFYCLMPNASKDTHFEFYHSLYYSLVTFTTLGYGDIHQTDTFLQLLSGFEALLGLTFWGLLIAGYTGRAKNY